MASSSATSYLAAVGALALLTILPGPDVAVVTRFALTGGRGFDLILEMLANVNLAKDLTVLARDGRVVVVGNRGTIEINPREAMRRDASILGMTLMNANDRDLAAIHAALVAGLENGALRPIVRTELPLAEAPRAHQLVMEAGAFGKIVLVP